MVLFLWVVATILFMVAVVRVQRALGLDGDDEAPHPVTEAEVRRLVDRGDLIPAIKVYRTLTGCGLKDAKEAVDRLRAGGVLEFPAKPAPPAGDDDLLALARSGRQIEAIKLYRERHHVGLAEAKQAIDRLLGS